jgi:hypothetical protein
MAAVRIESALEFLEPAPVLAHAEFPCTNTPAAAFSNVEASGCCGGLALGAHDCEAALEADVTFGQIHDGIGFGVLDHKVGDGGAFGDAVDLDAGESVTM